MGGQLPLIGDEDRLPRELGGLYLERVDHFPDPAMGVQIRYGIPPLVKADAYLYDLGLPALPEDLTSPEFAGWFQREFDGIVGAAEHGFFRDFEIIRSGFVNVPPESPEPLCLCASFAYRRNPDAALPLTLPGSEDVGTIIDIGRIASQLALRVDGGYFNKVRFDCPAEIGERGFGGFVRFMVAWTEFVRGCLDGR